MKTIIEETFTDDVYKQVDESLNKIFLKLKELIEEYTCQREKGFLNKELSYDIILILIFFSDLARNNLALLFILVDKFYQDFSNLNLQQEDIIETDKLYNIFDSLIKIWSEEFDNNTSFDSCFSIFLNSSKFQLLFAESFLENINIIIQNESEILKDFSLQVFTHNKISLRIVQDEEMLLKFFSNLNKTFFNILKEDNLKVDDERLDFLSKLVYEYYINICYLMKPETAKALSKSSQIIINFIDTVSLLQNRFIYKKVNSYAYEGFHDNIISIQLYMINIFSLLVSNFDFSFTSNTINHGIVILRYILEKNNKELGNDEYTFDIILNRCLAILLTRIGFYYSFTLNLSFIHAIKFALDNALSKEEESNNLKYNQILFNLLNSSLRFIGFINSIVDNYWTNYGENMLYFIQFYYRYDVFYNSDYTLIKILLSVDEENETNFSLNKYLSLTDTYGSYKLYQNNLFEGKYNFNSEHAKSRKLFIRNFETFIKILINDNYILDLLAYSANKITSHGAKDEILELVLKDEQVNLYKDIKLRILGTIISKANFVTIDELVKSLPFYLVAYFGEENIKEIIENSFYKKSSNSDRNTILFEDISKFEIFSIIEISKKLNADKFLKEKNITSVEVWEENLHFSFSENLNLELFKLILININTVNSLVNSLTVLLNGFASYSKNKIDSEANSTTNDYSNHKNLLFTFIKILDMLVNYCKKNEQSLSIVGGIITRPDLIDALNLVQNDNCIASQINVLYSKLKKLTGLDLKPTEIMLIGEINDSTYYNINNNSNLNSRFINNNINKYSQSYLLEGNSSIYCDPKIDCNKSYMITRNSLDKNEYQLEAENNTQISINNCVICNEIINNFEFFNKPYGHLGVASGSSFIYHSKLQTLKREFERNLSKHLEANETFNENDQMLMKEFLLSLKKQQPQVRNGLRFNMCEHLVHYNCFIKFKEFKCLKCENLCNIFLPKIEYFEIFGKYYKTNNNLSNIDLNNLQPDQFPFEYNHLKSLEFEEIVQTVKNLKDKHKNWDQNKILYDFAVIEKDHEHIEKFNNMASKDKTFLNVIISYVETLLFLKTKQEIKIEDFKKEENQEIIYEHLKEVFIVSLSLAEENSFMIQQYLLSLKLLTNLDFIDLNFLFKKFLNALNFCENLNESNIVHVIENDLISLNFFELIFNVIILFDENQFEYFDDFYKHFLKFFLLQFFVLEIYKNFSSNFNLTLDFFNTNFKFENFVYILNSPSYSLIVKQFLNKNLYLTLLLKSIFDEKNIEDILFKKNNMDDEELSSYFLNNLGFENYETSSFTSIDISNYCNFWNEEPNSKMVNQLLKIFNMYKTAKINSSFGDKKCKFFLLLNFKHIFSF